MLKPGLKTPLKVPLLGLLLSGLLLLPLRADPLIEKVMRRGFKGDSSLIKKTASGQATFDDMERLLALLRTLPNGRPPQGGNVAFQQRVSRITGLAQQIADGHSEAVTSFQSAVECTACHAVHRQEGR